MDVFAQSTAQLLIIFLITKICVEQVTAFSESAEITVVGFFNDADSAEAKEFIATADRNEDAIYGVSYDEAVRFLGRRRRLKDLFVRWYFGRNVR